VQRGMPSLGRESDRSERHRTNPTVDLPWSGPRPTPVSPILRPSGPCQVRQVAEGHSSASRPSGCHLVGLTK